MDSLTFDDIPFETEEPEAVSASEAPKVDFSDVPEETAAPEPTTDISFDDIPMEEVDTSWTQRGRQFVAGIVDPIAALPESAAISSASIESKMGGEDVTPASERDTFKAGESIRGAVESVVGAPDERDDSFMGQLAYGAGNIVGIGGSAILSSFAGGPWTGLAVGAAQGAAMNQAEIYKEAIAAGVDEQTAIEASDWAAAVGATEILPIGRALRLLPASVRKEVTGAVLKRIVALGKNGAEEGIQEYLSQVGNNIIAQQYYDPERGWTEGATEAALVGSILGVGTGAVGSTLDKKVEVVAENGATDEQKDALAGTNTRSAEAEVDPAISQAVKEQPVETPRERVLRMAKERDQRAKAAAAPATPATPPAESQSAPAPVAGTEPPVTVGDDPAAPPVEQPAAAETPVAAPPAEQPAAEAAPEAEATTEEAPPVEAPTVEEPTAEQKRSELFDKAVEAVRGYNNASLGFMIGRLGIGEKRARKLIFELEDAGVITKPDKRGKRTVIRDEVTARGNPDTNTVPEAQETLELQRQALTEGKRRAVFYPEGTPPLPRPSLENIGRIKVEGIGIFDFDKTKTTPKELREASKAGRLNDVLDLGPVNKEEVAQSAAQGATPVAVVERTPDGTEVKAAAGTEETAPDQVTALQATMAAPENTVSVEDPRAVVAQRQEPEVRFIGDKRVLADVSPEGIAQRQKVEELRAKQKADREAAEKAAAEAAAKADEKAATKTQALEQLNTKIEEKAFGSIEDEALARAKVGGANLQKQDQEAIVRGAVISKNAFDVGAAVMPDVVTNGQDLRQLGTLLSNILVDARTKFVEVQKELAAAAKNKKLTAKAKRALGTRTKGDYPTVTGPVIWLSEANSLSRRIELLKDNPTELNKLLADVNDFLNNSASLKDGDDVPLRETRKAKGAAIQTSKSKSSDTDRAELAGVDDMEFTESVRDEENAAGGRALELDTEEAADTLDKADIKTTTARPVDSTRVRPDEPVEEGVDYTVGKATKPVTVQTKKKRVLLKRETIAGEETYADLDESTILQTVTFSEALAQAGEIKGSGTNRTITNRMLSRLSQQIGDVKIHIVPQESLDAMFPDRKPNTVDGYYDPEFNYIIISDYFISTGQFDARLLAHEGVHAYLAVAIELEKKLKSDFEDILDFLRGEVPNAENIYGLANIHELLAEAMSNPNFQNMLMGMKVPDSLASKFDAPQNTLWQVLIGAIRKHLGFGRKDVDALSYVMRLGDRAETRAMKLNIKQRKFFGKALKEGLLSEGRRDYAQELKDGGVPDDIADDLGSFIDEQLGREIDPATLPLLMGDIIREFKDTPQSNPFAKGKAGYLRALAVKLNTLDYIRQKYNAYFNNKIDAYVKAIQKRENLVSDTSEPHDKNAAEFLDLMRSNRKEAVEMASIAMEATKYNVRVGPGADNKHLGDKAKKGLQGKKRLKELNARFDKLDPKTQDLYRRMVDAYRETHNNNIRALAYNTLVELDTKLSNSDLTMLMEKVVDGTLSEADAKLIGDADIFKELRAATSLKTIKGDYFPQMRFGDFVVISEDKIAAPGITSVTLKGNGKTVPVKSWVDGNVVKFQIDPSVRGSQVALDRAVMEYVENSDLTLLNVRKRSVDRKTGTVTPKGEQLMDRDYDVLYEIELQNKGVNFFESRKEAQKYRDDLARTAGNTATVSEVLDRRNDGQAYGDKLVSGSALTAVTKRINERKDIPEWQRKQMRNLLEHAIVSQMAGNRAQSRHMARRNVKGASGDIARAAVTYGQSAGNYYATLVTAPDIRKAFSALEMHEKNNAMKEGAGVRSMVMNELRARQQTMDDPLYLNKFVQNVAALSFFDKLVSPAYSIINFQQAIGNGIPYLGGKYGNARTSLAMANAYRKIGVFSTTWGGIKNTGKAIGQVRRSAIDTDDLIGSIRKKLGPKYDPLMDELIERGLVSPNSGFEIGQAILDGSGAFNTGIAKFDRIARQLPNAVEAVNRTVVAVTAFDLATSRGNSVAQAVQEAYDAVANTQGDYRRSNNPRFMNNRGLSWALQFKKYAVMQTQLVGDMYARALKGATKEDRAIARKQLANMMAVQVMYAGALGLPGLELAKLGFALFAIAGLGDGWDEFEEDIKGVADAAVGETWSELLRKGVISRAIGVDVSARMSQADMWTGFMPDKLDRAGLTEYMGSLLLGAPGSTLFDWFDATRLVFDGEFQKALEKSVPIKMVSDTMRGVDQLQSGKMTPVEAAVKSIGFQPSRIANIEDEKGSEIRDSKAVSDERKKLIRDYINATSQGEIAKLKAKIREFEKRTGRRIGLKWVEKQRKRELERYAE